MNRKLLLIAAAGLFAAAGLVGPALAGSTDGATAPTQAVPTAATTTQTGGWNCPMWNGTGGPMGPRAGMHRGMGMRGDGSWCWTQNGNAGPHHNWGQGPMHGGGGR